MAELDEQPAGAAPRVAAAASHKRQAVAAGAAAETAEVGGKPRGGDEGETADAPCVREGVFKLPRRVCRVVLRARSARRLFLA
eukprot:2717681-Prymnesium_polylepis.1